ncbi:general transcription factor II-I repeat domain-containing protein 2A [Trichonephila clavipes]|nr:general transcription factor II-I repeat domain-containing protein 2A [Trichonephila clavipes]
MLLQNHGSELNRIPYRELQQRDVILIVNFRKCLFSLKVPITNICNITTDGAPNMTGKKSGYLGFFNQNNPWNNVVFLHYVIHQGALRKSTLDMKPILDAVVKLVNTMRSRGLLTGNFEIFFHENVQSE